MSERITRALRPMTIGVLLAPIALGAARPNAAPRAGDQDFAILCRKVVTCASDLDQAQVFDDAVILVEDGKISRVGRARDIDVPAGYRVVDRSDDWVVPGMIDLHSHMGQASKVGDWNDSVWPVNSGLRVAPSVEPANYYFRRAVAGGVTSVLYIPGSGSNMSGAGVLLKTAPTTYEESLIRDPGSLKIAQAGNPERWALGQRRAFMNWNLRNVMRRGVGYAKAWEAFDRGEGDEPAFDPQFEIFRALRDKGIQVSAHTQIYQVVLMTLTMIRQEFGFDVFIDHGTFDGWRTGALAEKIGVQAIIGPRQHSAFFNFPGFAQVDTDGRFDGVAAGYQKLGHTSIGFNTDSVHPSFGGPGAIHTEELPFQAAMAVRMGLTNRRLEALRGLTIVPAMTVGLEDRIGSIEAGKDADLVISDGDPTDPRNRVQLVFVDGVLVYDRADDPTVW